MSVAFPNILLDETGMGWDELVFSLSSCISLPELRRREVGSGRASAFVGVLLHTGEPGDTSENNARISPSCVVAAVKD